MRRTHEPKEEDRMGNGPTTLVPYMHKRTRHAKSCGCPNGGPDGRNQFNLPAGATQCPHADCRGTLVQVNTGGHVAGKRERLSPSRRW